MDEIVSCMGEFIRDQYSQINSNNNNNNQEPLSFVLIGHSQGGAAVGQVYILQLIYIFSYYH